MFRPLLQISLKAFIQKGVTRKQECEFTNTCFAFIDDPRVSVETLRMHSFQKSIVFSSMNSVITVLAPWWHERHQLISWSQNSVR